MSRSRIINQLRKDNPYLNNTELEIVINTFSESIESALVEGKSVELRHFGTFFLKKIKEKYSARNPKSGDLIYVPAKNKVRFRASKKLKQIINR